MRVRVIFVLFTLLLLGQSFAQTIITGRVTDAETGDPIPFVNVFFQGTTVGITTDFDGYYKLQTSQKRDSICASYIGYTLKTKAIGVKSVVNFQLTSSETKVEAIEAIAGENPAWRIMRNVIKNKNRHNPDNLEAYDHESYTKLEFDADNLTDKFKNKIALKPFRKMLDSLKLMAGEDGKMILPVYMSEALSRLYIHNSPKKKKEIVHGTKITGIGMEDGTFLSQLAGASTQQYNVYKNWFSVLNREFVSPITVGWRMYYHYYLVDSLNIDGRFCYKIEIEPKRSQDLAFTGTIWIDKEDYALKQMDISVDHKANLNYIDLIKIQQQYTKTEDGYWMVEKTRVLIEIEKLNEDWVGMIAKFYTSNKDFHVNQVQSDKFFSEPVLVEERAQEHDENYWKEKRHDSLSQTELAVRDMVDSIRNLPLVKTYVEIFDVAINGYLGVGKFEIGPYLFLYTNNTVEGNRFRIGGRTSTDFSRKLQLKSYVAYGLKDQRFKYLAGAKYIFNRRPWTELEVQSSSDIVQLGLIEEKVTDDNLFMAFSNFGRLRQPFVFNQHHLIFQTDVWRGYTQSVRLMNKDFQALYPFAFYDGNGVIREKLTTSEIELSSRFARNERYLLNDNEKFIIDESKLPILTFNYAHGFKNVLRSHFNYDRVSLNVEHRLAVGTIGISRYSITAGKIFSTVPYPLLKVHLGNQTFFHNQLSYNLMNYFEFVSDQYVGVLYTHYFMGNILNRIPLMKKLKWRLLGEANVLYGTLSQQNMDIIPAATSNGTPITGFSSLDPYKPYVEIGYGVENIFRVLRVEAMHRLTYYTRPNANRFGIKVALQFEL